MQKSIIISRRNKFAIATFICSWKKCTTFNHVQNQNVPRVHRRLLASELLSVCPNFRTSGRRTDGKTDGETNEHTYYKPIDKHTDSGTDWQTNRQTGGRTDGRWNNILLKNDAILTPILNQLLCCMRSRLTDRQTTIWTNRRTHGQMGRQTYLQIDEQIGRWTERQMTDRQVERRINGQSGRC